MTLEDKWNSLSPREQQVTAYCRQGYSYAQIADYLALDLDAVLKYANSAIHKFGALNKTEMVLLLSRWDFDAYIPPAWRNVLPAYIIPTFKRKALQ